MKFCFLVLTLEMRQDLAVRLRMVYSGEGQQVFMGLDVADTLCFQLGCIRRRMTWRQFILALGLHTEQEMAEVGFGAYWDGSDRLIPDKGDLRDYWMEISSDRDFLGPAPSYVLIRDPVRRLCYRMIAYSIFGRGQAPEKACRGEEEQSQAVKRYFIGRLDMHFGLVSDEGLRGLQTWVAQGPEKQQAVAAGTYEADEAGLRGVVESFTTKQSRVSTHLHDTTFGRQRPDLSAIRQHPRRLYMSIPLLRPCMYDTAALLVCFSGGDVYPCQAYDTKLITTEKLSVNMDDPNINMEEYIILQEEKALSRGETFNWQTATYGKREYCDDEDDSFTNFKTEFPAIVFDDITSNTELSCESTVSPLNDNKIDFRISFDESDDEDYTVIYDENSFSYKIIYVNNLKTDSKNDNDKVNMPLFSTPEPEVSYFTDLDFFKDFENEFPAIVYNDALKSKLDFLTGPTISP
ncbi:hypothetical protein Tco_1096049 [Tanacetum coccineum]